MKLAYPKALFGRDVADGRSVCGVEYSEVSDVLFPPRPPGSSMAPPSAATCGASSGTASWTAP
eukprot:14596917-Alexandrium_andersonii.AAC.1